MNTSRTSGSHASKNIALVSSIAVTLVLWASAFPGIRAGLSGYAPRYLVLLRLLTASFAFVVIAPFARIKVPRLRHVPLLLLLGLTGIGGYNLSLSYGETHIPSGTASLLVNCTPVLTALLARLFLNERIRLQGWIGLIVSLAGVAAIVMTSGDRVAFDPWALLVLLAATLQAIFFILQKRLLAYYRPMELTSYAIWGGTLVALLFIPGFTDACKAAPIHATLAVVYLGIFPAALAYLTWAVVLAHLPVSRAGSLLYVVPVISFIIAWFWLQERPQASTLFGGALAISGVVLLNTAKNHVERNTNAIGLHEESAD